MQRRVEVLVGVGLLLSGCAIHHAELAPRPLTFSPRTLQYPSGLRVIFDAAPHTERVAISVLVGAGSASDRPGREGTAHLLEHLAYRSRPAGRLTAFDELDFAGVSWGGRAQPNAQTGFELTMFLGVMPAARAAGALPLMTALAVAPLRGVDDEAIDLERRIVSNERYDVDPHAGGRIRDALYHSVLPAGAPGSRSLAGTDASLAAIQRADLEAFVAEHYRPENVIFSIAGDLTEAEVTSLLARALPASWLSAPEPREPRHLHGAIDSRVLSPPHDTTREIVESRVPSRQLVVTWLVPGFAQLSGPAMPLVAQVMGDALPVPKGAKRLGTSLATDVHSSLLALTVELDDDADPDAVSRELRKNTWFGAFTPQTWSRLTELQLLDEQDVGARSTARAVALFSTGEARPLLRGPDHDSLEAIVRFEKGVLTWERAREVLIVPLVRRNDERATAVAAHSPQRGPRVQFDRALLEGMKLAVSPGDRRHFTLPNGLNVLLRKQPEVPVASVVLGLPATSAAPSLAVQHLVSHVLRWDSEDVWSVGRPNVMVSPDGTFVQLVAKSARLPLMLDVLGNSLPPRVGWFDVDDASRVVKRLQEAQTKEHEVPSARERLRRLVSAVLPKTHSLHAVELTDLAHMSRGEFTDFVDLAWTPVGAWLIVDGDLDFDATETVVRELFTRWRPTSTKPAQATRPPELAPLRPAGTRPTVVENQDAAATTVRFACRLPAAVDVRTRGAIELLRDALSTSFEHELRIERGLTYDVSFSATTSAREDNVLTLDLSLEAINRQVALRQFLQKLLALDGTLWNEEDLAVARWHVAKRHVGDRLSSESQAVQQAMLALAVGSTFDPQGTFAPLWGTPLAAVDEVWASCTESALLEIEGERSSITAVVDELYPKAH